MPAAIVKAAALRYRVYLTGLREHGVHAGSRCDLARFRKPATRQVVFGVMIALGIWLIVSSVFGKYLFS